MRSRDNNNIYKETYKIVNIAVSTEARGTFDARIKNDTLHVRVFQRTHWRAFQNGIHFASMFVLLKRVVETRLKTFHTCSVLFHFNF